MIATARSVALWAVLVFAFAASALAQQTDHATADDNSYLPPSQFIAKTPAASPQRSAATSPTAVPAASAAPASSTKTIGVISVIGDQFWVKRVGFTIFGNEEQKYPIAAWKIDDKVAATVGRVLKKTFRTKRIQVPAEAFAKLHEGTFIFNGREEAQAKLLAQYAAAQKCDYYLLISPGGSAVGATNQGISGLGVVRWDNLVSPGEYIHALSRLTVYDPQMKQLRSESGSIGQEGFMATIKGPHQELKDAGKLPPDAQAATADPRTQKLTWELLDKSLAVTLPKLFAVN